MDVLIPTNATEAWTVVLVVVTAVYAVVSFFVLIANRAVVSAMQQQTEALLRPYVSAEVMLRSGSPVLQLVIRNVGKATAENLRMSIDRPIHQKLSRGINLQELPLFSEQPMPLAAGAEIVHLLGMGHELLDEKGARGMPETFTVSARYSFGGRVYDEQHVIDVRPLVHVSVAHSPLVAAIIDGAKSIAAAISTAK